MREYTLDATSYMVLRMASTFAAGCDVAVAEGVASEAAPPESGILALPEEVLLKVFSCMPARSLAAAALVSKSWAQLAASEQLWHDLLQKESGESWPEVLFSEVVLQRHSYRSSAGEVAPGPPSWRRIYSKRRAMPRSVVIDAGSGYTKFGWSDSEELEGHFTTFLEFGNIEVPALARHVALFSSVFNCLSAQPAAQPIIISEPLCCADGSRRARYGRRLLRAATSEVLFKHLEVPALCCVNQAVLALYAAQKTSGMCVNIGFRRTTVVPVIEGRILRAGVEELDSVGAGRITSQLSELLEASGIQYTTMFTVRTIKERLCYVAEDYSAEMQAESNPATCQAEEGIYTLSHERFQAPEILFRPFLGSMRCSGIPDAVLHSLRKCKLARTGLDLGCLRTVLLAGGTAAMPGLASRMERELTKLFPDGEKFSVIVSKHGFSGAWWGARQLSNTSSFPEDWCVTREAYLDRGMSVVHTMAHESELIP